MAYTYIFGPVPSRRLGISLGIDLLPFKTCSFNCIYCECGRTTQYLNERKEFFPVENIFSEISDYLSNNEYPDFLTFSGSGEPTLYSKLGELISMCKTGFPEIKVAILTNSSLLYREDVRNECSLADVVLPSLDSARVESFLKLDRPFEKDKLNLIIYGLIEFRKMYEKEIWLEVFFAQGINDSLEDLNALHDAIIKIKPDLIQLNTLDRPPTESFTKPVSKKFLEDVAKRWNDLPVEIISRYKNRDEIENYSKEFELQLLSALKRRPLTRSDLTYVFNKPMVEIAKYLDILEFEKKIKNVILNKKIFIQILN
ncbi:MAG: radical SAM protein [Spirochaetales bacterium]|jgi:wyosine [tRNA(Phe)-imidazoG37] synthetase (radical SAM superfamily)|nr:radical SAM protein [Exilispira sp.]NMC67678.1 radical SAM protein [Spirochaetales bacterium]